VWKVTFVGYETTEADGEVLDILRDDADVNELRPGERATVVLRHTPFYAEHGGQAGDTGQIIAGDSVFGVEQTLAEGDIILHIGTMQRNHTATHLMQAALRQVLGDHVRQAGSHVGPDRLRFDFSHHQAISQQQLDQVEDIVNGWIVEAMPVTCVNMPIEEAKDKGAIALFGEKYGDIVRTVQVDEGRVSLELCGGTHCSNTGEIGLFRILSESSVAAGTRRIEAVTGLEAACHSREVEQQLLSIARHLRATPDEILDRVEALEQRIKELQDEVKAARQMSAATSLDDVLTSVQEIDGVKFIAWHAEGADAEAVSAMADDLAARIDGGIVFLAGTPGDRAVFVCKVDEALVKVGYKAGDILKAAAAAAGGKGGGKPTFAQGGGEAEKVEAALQAAAEAVASRGG